MKIEELLKRNIELIGLPNIVVRQLKKRGVFCVEDLYLVGFVRLMTLRYYSNPYFDTMLTKLKKMGFDTKALLDGKGRFTKEEVAFLRMPIEKVGLPEDVVRMIRGGGVKTLADVPNFLKDCYDNKIRDRVINCLPDIGIEAESWVAYQEGNITLNHDKMPMALIADYINEMERVNADGRANPKVVEIENMGFSTRTYTCLRRANIETLHDLLCFSKDRLFKVRNMGACSIGEIEEKLHGMGYSVGELADEKKNFSRKLADGLLRDGLKVLETLENIRFEKGSSTMTEIGETVEKYLNTLVETKSKTAESNEDFDKIEKELSALRADYKKIVDSKRAELKALAERKAGFVAKMTAKNGEVRRYHHNPNSNHEHTHTHNPFANNEREL